MDLLSEKHGHLSVESTPHTSYLLSDCLSSETLLPFTFLRLIGVPPFVYQTLRFCLFYYILQNPNLWVFSPSHALHPTPWDVSFPSPARSPANLPQGPHGLQALIATFITQGINTTKHLLSLHHVTEATKYFQGCGCPQASEPQRLTA